jgi:hypothetical protein
MPRTPNDDRYKDIQGSRASDSEGEKAYSFHVRVWRERGIADLWRGTISDLEGQRFASFSSVARLAEILSDPAGVLVLLRPDDHPDPGPAAAKGERSGRTVKPSR